MTSITSATALAPRATTLPLTAGVNVGSVSALGGLHLGGHKTLLYVIGGAVVGCVLPIPGGPLGGAILGYLIARFT
jgi:hypothetical protein